MAANSKSRSKARKAASTSAETAIAKPDGVKVLDSTNMWWAFDQPDPRGGNGPVGRPYTYLKALENSTLIYSMVERIAVDSLQADLSLVRGRGINKQRLEEHPLLDLIARPNPFTTGRDFRTSFAQSMLLRGSCFLEVTLNRAGTLPAQVDWVHPDALEVVPDAKTFVKAFTYKPDKDSRTIELAPFTIQNGKPRGEIVWAKKFNPNNPYAGLSPLASLRATLALDQSAQVAQAASYENGGMTAGIVSPKADGQLSENATKALAKSYRGELGGARNAQGILFTSEPVEFQRMGINPSDMVWLDTRRFTQYEVANAFRVPIALLDPQYTSYDNLRASKLLHWEAAVIPEIEYLCEVLNNSVVRAWDPEGKLGLRFEPDLSSVSALMPQYADREKATNDAILAGRLTINEARAMEGKQPVPWGDAFWGNAMTLDLAKGDGSTLPVRTSQTIALPPTDAQVPGTPIGDAPDPAKAAATTEIKAATPATRVIRTPQARAAVGARHANAINQIAGVLHGEAKAAFTKQRDAVLANMPAKKAGLTLDSIFVSAKADLDTAVHRAFLLASTEAYASVAEQLGKGGKSGGTDGTKADGLPPKLTNPRLIGVSRDLASRVSAVDEFTRQELGNALEEGLRRGYSIDQIANGFEKESYRGISGVFEDAIDGSASASRAEMIARTETAYAYTRSSTSAFADEGIAQKEWQTGIGDDREGICAKLDGEIVNVDDAFSDGSYAPPDPHPNCTCNVLPVIPDNSGLSE